MPSEGEKIKVKVFVNLERIKSNLVAIRNQIGSGKQLIFMLKADAYGHGLEKVAEATCDMVDGFGVFSLEEGLKVRKIAPQTPVLVNMLDAREIETAIKNELIIGLSNDFQLAKIESLARRNIHPADVKIHVKVDSGMHRLGFEIGEIERVCQRLKDSDVTVGGVYSHFGDHPCGQVARFDTACRIVRGFFPNALRHIASTHTLKDASKHYDCVRVGLAAFWGAMRVESTVVASRRVEAGEYIGYGDYVSSKPTNVAVVFGGYADGIDRNFDSVKVRDRDCRVLCVCMDSTIIDTGDVVAKVGERVEILCADDVQIKADTMNTIPYTLMTAWRGRIDKICC